MHLPHRIPIPVRPDNGHGFTRRQSRPQEERERDGGTVPTSIFIAIGVIASILCVIVIFWFMRWKDKRGSKKGKYEQASGSESATRQIEAPTSFDAAATESQRNVSNVTRETSVRSVLTLPAYRHNPNDNEQVLGREGERDGVDVVVEFPTAEDMEAMRNEEMEMLYQVRLARRQEIAQREEQRRLREEARRRGDTVALADLRSQRRAGRDGSHVDELRQAHVQAKDRRQRAVSSVSYHDLGVARHDGTRIRAGSTDSERIGLLSDAASMAPSTRPTSSTHQRERSTSSVLSFDSESGLPSPAFPRSGATTPRLSNSHTLAGSSPEIIVEADLGEAGMPTNSPPDYEEVSLDDVRSGATTPVFNEPPPTYSGPTSEWDRRLSSHSADLSNHMGEDGDLSNTGANSDRRDSRSSVRSSRGVGGVPQLPSLRIGSLPQIVIQPEDISSNERR